MKIEDSSGLVAYSRKIHRKSVLKYALFTHAFSFLRVFSIPLLGGLRGQICSFLRNFYLVLVLHLVKYSGLCVINRLFQNYWYKFDLLIDTKLKYKDIERNRDGKWVKNICLRFSCIIYIYIYFYLLFTISFFFRLCWNGICFKIIQISTKNYSFFYFKSNFIFSYIFIFFWYSKFLAYQLKTYSLKKYLWIKSVLIIRNLDSSVRAFATLFLSSVNNLVNNNIKPLFSES